MATQQTPVCFDSTNNVMRPLAAGEVATPASIPLSATAGNQIQALTDGLYLGTYAGTNQSATYYVNGSTGVDATSSGSKGTPYKTLDYALAQVNLLFPQSAFNGDVVIALQAGQTFTHGQDFNVYGGGLTITFYGDVNYGDFNSAAVGSGAIPSVMSDLARPVISCVSSTVNSQYVLAGFNRWAGSITFLGVSIQLPAAPSGNSISLYSQTIDVVRSMPYATPGYVVLEGSIVNITDVTAYWGFLGINSRSTTTTLQQFASQFQVNGTLLSSTLSPAPTTAQLVSRSNFIKFYMDYAGNNQQVGYYSTTSSNSSSGSGILSLSWTDTQSQVVTGVKTNLAAFPIANDPSYGLRNYVFNLNLDQQSRPLNIVSSRAI